MMHASEKKYTVVQNKMPLVIGIALAAFTFLLLCSSLIYQLPSLHRTLIDASYVKSQSFLQTIFRISTERYWRIRFALIPVVAAAALGLGCFLAYRSKRWRGFSALLSGPLYGGAAYLFLHLAETDFGSLFGAATPLEMIEIIEKISLCLALPFAAAGIVAFILALAKKDKGYKICIGIVCAPAALVVVMIFFGIMQMSIAIFMGSGFVTADNTNVLVLYWALLCIMLIPILSALSLWSLGCLKYKTMNAREYQDYLAEIAENARNRIAGEEEAEAMALELAKGKMTAFQLAKTTGGTYDFAGAKSAYNADEIALNRKAAPQALKEKQSIALAVVLNLLTFFLYNIYWQYTIARKMRRLAGESVSGCADEVVLLFFCGFVYAPYWYFRQVQTLMRESKKFGRDLRLNSVLFLVLSLLTFGLVPQLMLQSELNALADDLNGMRNPEQGVRPTKVRKIYWVVLFSMLTMGIYYHVWVCAMCREIKRYRGEKGGGFIEWLCISFVPFYALYWMMTRSEQLYNLGKADGAAVTSNSFWIMLLSGGVTFLALIPLTGPFLMLQGVMIPGMWLMQENLNAAALCRNRDDRSAQAMQPSLDAAV